MGWVTLTLRKRSLKQEHSYYQLRELQISRERRQLARKKQYETAVIQQEQRNEERAIKSQYRDEIDGLRDQLKALREQGRATHEFENNGYYTLGRDYKNGEAGIDFKGGDKLDASQTEAYLNSRLAEGMNQFNIGAANESNIKNEIDDINSQIEDAQISRTEELNDTKTYYEDELAMVEEEAADEEVMLDMEQTEIEAQMESISAEIEAVGQAVSQEIKASTIKLA